MSCEGCAKAVRNVLSKTPGIESVEIDLVAQQVTTVGTASKEGIVAAISKTGKTVVAL
jgi:copper chaperone CopZ